MRNNAWVALGIAFGIIVLSVALHSLFITITTPDGEVIEGNLFNLEEGANIEITGDDATNTITITGTATSSLPSLTDDNIWVGNSSDVATETALPDCDNRFEATTYVTVSNTIGCQSIPTTYRIINVGGNYDWEIPGYSCNDGNIAIGDIPDDVVYSLIVPSANVTYTAIGIQVLAAGSVGSIARLGIYEATETSDGWIPGALVVDAGTVSIATTGSKSIAISEALTSGQPYFLAFVHNDAASTLTVTRCLESEIVVAPQYGRATGLADGLQYAQYVAGGAGTGALADPAPSATYLIFTGEGTVVRLAAP